MERLEKEASKAGTNLEGYVLELLLRDVDDPLERAREYVEVARDLLEQAREELGRGDVRQAAEKTWGAAAIAVKAYAEWREGRRLASHGELWEYKKVMEKEVGDWVYEVWAVAQSMHTCFYEGWCSSGDVEKAIGKVARLVGEVEKRVSQG